MVSDPRLGLVGAGSRGSAHIAEIYRLRRQNHLGSDAGDGVLNSPQPLYETYAADHPEWVEDVSDLQPTVSAVFDPSADARQAAAAVCRDGGDDPDLFETYEAFLERGEYDAVVVASPNDTHVELAVPLLERGVDVLCEKPLATTLEDHDRLEAAVRESEGLFYPGFNMRSLPYYRRLVELVAEGAIGSLGMISCREVRMPFPDGHYYTQAESGGSLLEKNCHDFDLMNWVTGADPVRVCAFGGQDVFTEGTDVNDHAVVIVEYENGVRASLDLCLYAPYGDWHPEFHGRRDYQFRGTEGILASASDGSDAWELYARRRRETYETGGFAGGHGGGDYLQMRTFLRCLQGRTEPPATVTDAKRAAAIALGAERSIRESEIVGIDSRYDLR
ncbi:Gfo/Idh/MocA family protein [Natrononativus amylolyticus]|uniref:Gfo/Idh/MocA family protein n=1 Tax=Natrononativus amylolyticus TaxID=2963434 RepID=UPI0020CC8586|nr:Gfo/Idh/MocA family oxidoreductase [Natrononativus amylolyticus]